MPGCGSVALLDPQVAFVFPLLALPMRLLFIRSPSLDLGGQSRPSEQERTTVCLATCLSL